MKFFLILAIIQGDIKTTRHGDNKLMQILVRMPAALGPARHIIHMVDALNREWDLIITFNKCEVAMRVMDFRQLNNSAMF